MRYRVLPLLSALVLVLSGCGGGSFPDDPSAEEACELLVQFKDADDFEAMFDAAEAAADARDPGVRAAVREPPRALEGIPVVNQVELGAACEDAGYDIPED